MSGSSNWRVHTSIQAVLLWTSTGARVKPEPDVWCRCPLKLRGTLSNFHLSRHIIYGHVFMIWSYSWSSYHSCVHDLVIIVVIMFMFEVITSMVTSLMMPMVIFLVIFVIIINIMVIIIINIMVIIVAPNILESASGPTQCLMRKFEYENQAGPWWKPKMAMKFYFEHRHLDRRLKLTWNHLDRPLKVLTHLKTHQETVIIHMMIAAIITTSDITWKINCQW